MPQIQGVPTRWKEYFLHPFLQESRQMAHHVLARAFLKPAATAHALSPRGVTVHTLRWPGLFYSNTTLTLAGTCILIALLCATCAIKYMKLHITRTLHCTHSMIYYKEQWEQSLNQYACSCQSKGCVFRIFFIGISYCKCVGFLCSSYFRLHM